MEVAGAPAPGGEGQVLTFELAAWKRGCLVAQQDWQGRLFATDESLIFQPNEGAARNGARIVRIPYTALADVRIEKKWDRAPQIHLRGGELNCVHLYLLKGGSVWSSNVDTERMIALHDLLSAKLSAAGK